MKIDREERESEGDRERQRKRQKGRETDREGQGAKTQRGIDRGRHIRADIQTEERQRGETERTDRYRIT